MRAMILAAGYGKRLRPLTDKTPKVLLPVKGEPLIVHHIRRLTAAGFGPLVINVGHLGDQIEAFIGDGSRYQTKILYSRENPPLEVGGGIVKALPLLCEKPGDPFLAVSGDLYTDLPFEQLPTAPRELAHLVLVKNPSWHVAGDFCMDRDNRVSNPEKNQSTLTFASMGVYRPELFIGAPEGPFKFGPWLQKAADNRTVTGEVFNGRWYNVGTLEELKAISVA